MVPFRSPSPCVGCKKKPEIISSLFDAMRIKIKCQFDQPPKKNQKKKMGKKIHIIMLLNKKVLAFVSDPQNLLKIVYQDTCLKKD